MIIKSKKAQSKINKNLQRTKNKYPIEAKIGRLYSQI